MTQLTRQAMIEPDETRDLKEMAEQNEEKRQERSNLQQSTDEVDTAKVKDQILKEDSELTAPHPTEDFKWNDEKVRQDQAASDLNTSNTCSKEKLDFFNCLDKHPKSIRECQRVINQMDFCKKDFNKYAEMKRKNQAKSK